MATQVTIGAQSAQLSGIPARVRITQALMLVVGLVGSFGVAYFTMLEPEDGMNAIDGAIAGLLLVGSLGYLAAGRKLALGDSEIWAAALGFAALRVALSLVKVFGYEEGEAISLLVLDVAILGLLLVTNPGTSSQRAPGTRTSV